MAKQNFLSGGYYGKLGDTVGQRWKNKRTIRTYVVPENPRTYIQQANRSVFADAVTMCKIGEMMNFNTYVFNSESMIRWNFRMQTCLNLKKLQVPQLNMIPLKPINITAPFEINSASIIEKIANNEIKVKIAGTLPTEKRKYSIVIYDTTKEQTLENMLVGSGESAGTNFDEIIFRFLESAVITDTTVCRISSSDDNAESRQIVFSNQMPLLTASGI